MKQLQDFVNEFVQWQNETFPTCTPLSMAYHLQKESKELTEAMVDLYDLDHIKEEYADCFLLLFGSAHRFGMSVEDLFNEARKKLLKNRARTWGTPDDKGVVNHIKD